MPGMLIDVVGHDSFIFLHHLHTHTTFIGPPPSCMSIQPIPFLAFDDFCGAAYPLVSFHFELYLSSFQ